ncbi:hypothetical protein MKA58_06515 [[Clostridium] innocuum]|nr:hypothetical protein [[Clostridium] innocuum]
MQFKVFFSMLKKRISDGADVPYFFKDLIAMITDVVEDEWGTPKDSSTKLSKESTIRSYAKRDLSQKFAQSIVYRLTPEFFVRVLNKRPKATRVLLADDYRAVDASANEANIAKLLAECFVDIIRGTAGLVQQTVLEKQQQIQAEVDIRNRLGDCLINEAGYTCSFPSCY